MTTSPASRSTAHADRAAPSRTALVALQVFSVLTLLNLGYQYVTAGRLFPGDEDLHAAGAIVLHVVSGLAAVAAIALWYRTRTWLWPAVLAVVLFVLTFVQAATGGRDTLAVHIPGAMVLVVGSTLLTVWSLRRTPRL